MPVPAATSKVAEASDALSSLLKNPLVIAGGAVLVGLLVTRVFGALPVKKLAGDLAAELFKKGVVNPVGGSLTPSVGVGSGESGGGGPAAGGAVLPTSVAAEVLQKGWDQYGPQISGFAQKLLAQLGGKKQ